MNRALDTSIFFSFTNIGFWRHRRSFLKKSYRFVQGKHALITGASRGLGAALALDLKHHGMHVHQISRFGDHLEKKSNTFDRSYSIDLSKNKSLYSSLMALENLPALDLLVLNAGGMGEFSLQEGNCAEDIFASQVLGHFSLLRFLIDHSLLCSQARILFVSSGGMYLQALDLSDLCFQKNKYSKYQAYANAKRAQVILNEMLAEKYPEYIFAAMHPGWAKSQGVKNGMQWFYYLMFPFLRSLKQGVDTLSWLSLSEQKPKSGAFFFDREEVECHFWEYTRETEQDRQALWKLCEEVYEAQTRS